MTNKVTVSPANVGLGGLLFVLFLGLKLTGYIDWSWWWVTAPLWIPAGLALLAGGIVLALYLIARSCKALV